MHEFSIATSLIEVIDRHAPNGAKVRGVRIEAGPLQGVDKDAMEWAWQGATEGGPYAGSTITIVRLPWRMKCPACDKEHASDEMTTLCECGKDECYPVGGSDLRLVSITIDDEEDDAAGAGDRERSEAQ